MEQNDLPSVWPVRLSRHAWARWCEQAWDAPFTDVEAHVMTDERRNWLSAGATSITMPDDGMRLWAFRGTVMTVTDIADDWGFCALAARAKQVRLLGFSGGAL